MRVGTDLGFGAVGIEHRYVDVSHFAVNAEQLSNLVLVHDTGFLKTKTTRISHLHVCAHK